MKRHAIEEGRAHQAYRFVEEAQEQGVGTEYKRYVKNIPMLVKTNGLGATLAFVQGKATKSGDEAKAYGLIYDHIGQWLRSDQKAYLLAASAADSDELVEQVVAMDSSAYRAVTTEVLALFNWLRRFVDGLIEDSN